MENYNWIISDGPALSIRYKSSAEEKTDISSFRELLEQVSGREMDLGLSLVGPHRDDVALVSEHGPYRQFASRGQMRIASMALKMSEVWYMARQKGKTPVLLIDDVLYELDLQHRKLFLERLEMFKDMQVFRCSTERSFVPDISECLVHEL
jgi:recombinational DNA repair ATPase RecF